MKKGIIILSALFLTAILVLSFAIAEQTQVKNKTGSYDEDDDNNSQNDDNNSQNDSEDDEDNNDSNKSNQGLGQTIRNKVKAGIYTNEEGEEIRVSEMAQNRIKLKINNTEVETELEIEEEQVSNKTKLKVKLSNGRNAEVKIMPDTASERALERLRLKVCSEENNCRIELKEVGKGEETQLVYELKAEKQGKFLGLFKIKMKVQAQVDAENGDVIKVKKPWWVFLVNETDQIIGDERDKQGCLGSEGYYYDKEIQACIKTWKLDDPQRQAAKIAVEHLDLYNSLTITEVKIIYERYATVSLTDEDNKETQVTIDLKNLEVINAKGFLIIEKCKKVGGIWRTFSDTCVDSCDFVRKIDGGCDEALTDSCDCGPDKCWNLKTQTCENN